jgi:hypothetical protein
MCIPEVLYSQLMCIPEVLRLQLASLLVGWWHHLSPTAESASRLANRGIIIKEFVHVMFKYISVLYNLRNTIK